MRCIALTLVLSLAGPNCSTPMNGTRSACPCPDGTTGEASCSSYGSCTACMCSAASPSVQTAATFPVTKAYQHCVTELDCAPGEQCAGINGTEPKQCFKSCQADADCPSPIGSSAVPWCLPSAGICVLVCPNPSRACPSWLSCVGIPVENGQEFPLCR
jgi:hypothetical protein